jgi:HEAT repeat protein
VGTRTLEEPALLRRVAVGFLRREADLEESPARLDALRILAGDPGSGPDLRTIKDGPGAIRLRAALGEEAAVRTVIDELASGAANKMAAIDALAQSGAPQALPAVMAQLKDPRPEVRAAAAEGLGRLGAQGGLPALRTAYQSDQSPFVRTKAAAALLKLNDTSGLAMLRELLVSDSPEGRLAGAEALADTPDGTWTDVVRGLAQSGEPTIRLAAARLIGATDPALARAIADTLAVDTNLAVRELATRVQAELGGRDLARLRPLLRSADPLTRVKAAGGILAATR